MEVLRFEELDSTQLEAKRYVKNNSIANGGTVIIADNQTDGIGTHGRRWFSKKKESITFTMILMPNCNIEKLKNITLQIAECILQAFRDLYNISLNIKEPNDIVFNGKKIGGILTETKIADNKVKFLFIGIGLNTNQLDFPAEIKSIATSIKSEFGIDIDNDLIINDLIERISKIIFF